MEEVVPRRSSIARRLRLLVGGALVTAVLMVGGIALLEQRRQLTRALETKAASLAQFMAQVSPISVLSLNFVEMNNNVRKVVLTDDEAVYAIILNEKGIPLTYYLKDADPVVTGEVRGLWGARSPLAAVEAMKRSARILEVEAPITAGERHIGSATVGFSFDRMRRAIRLQGAVIAAILVFITAVSLLLLGLSLRTILHPVQDLTSAALQISAGNLNVVLTGTNRTDELGVLSRAFESMATQLRGLIASMEQRMSELQRMGQALQKSEEEIRRFNQELELRVAARTSELQAANRELETFTYSVSHDLRLPLRTIDGFLGLLKKRQSETLDEESRRYMATISDAALRLARLIDDLLLFSRSGRFEMKKAPVDLGALVQEVVRELKPAAQGRLVEWRIGELPVVSGDRAMLRMVFGNLISNALKFTQPRERAEIEIGSQPDGEGEITVSVRDNGVGFDMQYAHKLFRVFERLHGVDEFEGTGIGLANVRRVISRHGGRTWAEGKVDGGATFYFSLPRPLSNA